MKPAPISEIKAGLRELEPAVLADLCLQLARHKVENKELLSYLLFQKENEAGFIEEAKEEITALLALIQWTHPYFIRKSLRKIIRLITKYIKFSGNRITEVELRLHFLQKLPLKRTDLPDHLILGQFQKLKDALASLHEDMQFDYQERLEEMASRIQAKPYGRLKAARRT